MLSINTNTSASVSASNLTETNRSLQRSLQRLSSGSRIVESKDDAGGLAVSMKMSAAIRRTDATNINVQNAQSFLKTQDGAFNTAAKILTRMSELATLSQDVTKTSSDRANYSTEFKNLQEQLTELAKEKFNGVNLFGTSTTSASSTLQVYINEDSTISSSVTVAGLLNTTTGIGNATLTASTAIDTIANAVAATSVITTALQNLATMRAQNGSEASRLAFAQEQLVVNRNNLEAANSRIIDVDVASESTQLARFNILQQAGTAMLAQANQAAQSVLRLLS